MPRIEFGTPEYSELLQRIITYGNTLAGSNFALKDHHREEFFTSAISPEVIEAAKIRSLTAPQEESAALGAPIGRMYKHVWGDSWLAPFFNAENEPYYCMLKHDNPRDCGEGKKPTRYESVCGGGKPPVYLPIDVRKRIQSSEKLILITEGIKKTLAAYTAGFCSIGLNGVWGWKGDRKEGGYALEPYLNDVDWRNRIVLIAFDSDAVENRQVGKAEERCAEAIRRKSRRQVKQFGGQPAHVVLVSIPPDEETGEKLGLDDFIHKYGVEAFKELVAIAVEGQPLELTRIGTVDPDHVATEFLDATRFDGVCTHVFQPNAEGNKELKRWTGAGYRTSDQKDMADRVGSYLRTKYSWVIISALRNIIQAIRNQLNDDTLPEMQPPMWRGDPPSWFSGDWNDLIIVPQGIYDWRNDNLYPHTPALYNVRCLAVNFDPRAPKPKMWLAHLNHKNVFDGNPDKIRLNKQWLGHCMTAGPTRPNIMQYLGPPRSGKGILVHVPEYMCGEEGVGTVSLKKLGKDFALAELYQKQMVIFNEVRVPRKENLEFSSSLILEYLLAMTGGDKVSVSRKFRDALHVCWGARVVFTSNEQLALLENSGALGERVLTLETCQTFDEKERILNHDKQIYAKDASGILNLGIEGLRDLGDAPLHVVPTAEGELSLKEQMQEAGSWLRACVNEKFKVTPEAGPTVKTHIFSEIQTYCTAHNILCPDDHVLGKDLLNMLRGRIKEVRRYDKKTGKQVRCYAGIALLEERPSYIGDEELTDETELESVRKLLFNG